VTPAPPGPDAALRQRCRRALYEHSRRAAADHQGALEYGLPHLLELARTSPCCAYCGAVLDAGLLSFDHQLPTCRVADYRLSNLVVCCTACNTAKGLLSAEEFRHLLALLRTWHPRAGNDVLGRLRAGGVRYARSRRRGA